MSQEEPPEALQQNEPLLAETAIKDQLSDNALPAYVESLKKSSYREKIETLGLIKPCSQTPLSSEVRGEILKISPAFEVGKKLKKGDLLAELDDSAYRLELIESQARLAKAELQYEQAKIDTQIAKEEWYSIRDYAPPNQMTLKGKHLEVAKHEVEVSKMAVSMAQKYIDKCKVVMPYDGVVLDRSIGLGQLVTPNSLLGSIYSEDCWRVSCEIIKGHAESLGFFHQNDAVKAIVKGANLKPLPFFSFASLVNKEGSILTAYFDHNGQKLSPTLLMGLYVDLEIYTEQEVSCYKVKNTSIYQGQLLGVTPDNLLTLVPISLVKRLSGESYVKIDEGFVAPERVVVSRLNTVASGMLLAPKRENVLQKIEKDVVK